MGMRDNLMTRQGLILGLLVAVTQYICITTTILALDDFFFKKKSINSLHPVLMKSMHFLGKLLELVVTWLTKRAHTICGATFESSSKGNLIMHKLA